MFLTKRSKKLELIDLGPSHYSPGEYLDCLDKLDKVGEYLGGDRASFKAIKEFFPPPKSILDVGCGGGGFTQKLGMLYKDATITGIEISREAINHAQAHNKCPNVLFKLCNLTDIPTKSYDIVICTLVCHHFSDEDLVIFLRECLRVAKRKVILNDLHRHPLAWLGFSLIAPILFRNRLITLDGCLSVKRAFKSNDWNYYLKQLKISGRLSWHWPFRWIVTMEV